MWSEQSGRWGLLCVLVGPGSKVVMSACVCVFRVAREGGYAVFGRAEQLGSRAFVCVSGLGWYGGCFVCCLVGPGSNGVVCVCVSVVMVGGGHSVFVRGAQRMRTLSRVSGTDSKFLNGETVGSGLVGCVGSCRAILFVFLEEVLG